MEWFVIFVFRILVISVLISAIVMLYYFTKYFIKEAKQGFKDWEN
jgi:hypothetical protein